MFNRDRFNILLAGNDFETAYTYLQSHQTELMKNPVIDRSTKTTLLHDVARSAELNDALSSGNKSANRLLSLAFKCADFTAKEKPISMNPFHVAVEADHRAIISSMLSHLRQSWNGWDVKAYLMLGDKNKRLPLHYAVINCNHELVDELVNQDDVERTMFFKRDKAGFFAAALALKQYHTNPNDLSLSMLNQLYFSLPHGKHRTRIAEEHVAFGWGTTRKAMWQTALRMCAKRDENNKITGIDLNLVDFINQAVKDGIEVWGFHVSNELMFEYSKHYSGTPGDMLRGAFETLEVGLPGRTLGQATENTTLSRYKEFMQRAKLSEGNYWLKTMENDPRDASVLSRLNLERDYMILYADQLYYVPQVSKNDKRAGRECLAIDFAEIREKDQKYYTELKGRMSSSSDSHETKATNAELKCIIALIPLTMPKKVADTKIDLPFASRKGVGMTFFSDYTPVAKDEGESEKLLDKKTPKFS